MFRTSFLFGLLILALLGPPSTIAQSETTSSSPASETTSRASGEDPDTGPEGESDAGIGMGGLVAGLLVFAVLALFFVAFMRFRRQP